MQTCLIGYDLNKPRGDNDYPNLIEAIKGLSDTWWHHLDSTWLVATDQTVVAIRDQLSPYLDSGDELLVVRLQQGEWASSGLSDKAVEWLRNNA